MAYDTGVRQYLTGKGVNPADIGYSNGSVTLKGQNFMKPSKNYTGTTYDSKQNLDSAWNTYNTNKVNSWINPGAINPNRGSVLDSAINTIKSRPAPTTPTTPTNPYTGQVNSAMDALLNYQPQQVDPYSTDAYKAFAAQSDRRTHEGIRAAQESLGSSGFGRSTALGERAQGVQNQEEEYLTTQAIPQIIAQQEAKNQQEYNNKVSSIKVLMEQQGFTADEAQRIVENDRNKRLDHWTEAKTVSDMTGKVIKPQDDPSGLYRQGADPNTPLSAAGQEQAFNQDINMAALTGMINGKPTTAQQQTQLENLWKVADATGIIPNALADQIGVPRGTQTAAAKQLAVENNRAADSADLQWIQEERIGSQGTGSSNKPEAGISPTTAGSYMKSLLMVDDPTRLDSSGNPVKIATNDYGAIEDAFLAAYNMGVASGKDVTEMLVRAGVSPANIAELKKDYPTAFQGK